MKRIFLLMFVMFVTIAAKSQTLYYLEYHDNTDKKDYFGLWSYFDETETYLRCIPDDEEGNIWDCLYTGGRVEKNGKSFVVYSPQPNEPVEEGVYPYFVFTEDNDIPYVVYRIADVGTGKMKKSKDFFELDLAQCDEEIISTFYDKDEEMYSLLLQAHKNAKEYEEQPQEVVSENNVENNASDGGDVTMHFIMVAATKDPSIGQSVETDLNLVYPEFQNYAKRLGIAFKSHLISGYDVSAENVTKEIQNLKVGKNDVVVFVYSGHGFRFDNDTDPYPRMLLTYDELTEDYVVENQPYLAVSDVYDAITKKGARLTIVLSDCCNSSLGMDRPEIESNALAARGSNNYDVEKLKKLFLLPSGAMKVTAAKAGQVALCDNKGGFLLTSFLNNLRKQISATTTVEPSWQTIVENSSAFVRKKTEGFDEEGKSRDPQVVVRSINLAGSAAVSGEASSLADLNSSNSSSDDDDSLFAGLLCILLPIIVVVILIIVIIKLLKSKKQNNNNQNYPPAR
jgi:hypothetical protein